MIRPSLKERRVFRGDHMVFRVNKGGDQSSPTDGERGYRRKLWGGGEGGDHKNIKKTSGRIR